MVPYVEDSVILGGFSTPGVGVVDSLRAGTLMRERAQRARRADDLRRHRGHRHRRRGRPRPGVRTDKGDIAADTVVIACGVWSPRIARMAGAAIPLTPAVHQMISVGPVPLFGDTVGEITFPIVRDMDTNMYERQHGGDLEVGSYAHRPILMDADDIPSIAASALSPTELPFTQEDFDLQMEQALELVPDVLGDETVGIRHAINGLLSLTPDGKPILGETPEVKGLWSVAGDLDQGGARHRPDRGRVDDPRHARDRPPRLGHRPLLRPPEDRGRTSRRAAPRASTRPTASSIRWSSGHRTATCG